MGKRGGLPSPVVAILSTSVLISCGDPARIVSESLQDAGAGHHPGEEEIPPEEQNPGVGGSGGLGGSAGAGASGAAGVSANADAPSDAGLDDDQPTDVATGGSGSIVDEPGDAGTAPSGTAGESSEGPTASDDDGPSGADLQVLSFANLTRVDMPTGPALASSAISVIGANGFLWDVDVGVTVPHTFSADLDVTLTSPAGTIVTLISDDGNGSNDVFAGTVFDDSANLLGQVPYTTNAGLAADHDYQDLTLATRLVPEEPLSAFFGEDPNGEWILSVTDDQLGDGGHIAQWELSVTSRLEAPVVTSTEFASLETSQGPVALVDDAVISSAIAVPAEPAAPSVCGVRVFTDISHTFAADLDITVSSPNGTVVTLTTDNGAGNDDVFKGTLWDDDAAPGNPVPYAIAPNQATDAPYTNLVVQTHLTPEEGLGAFRGEPAAGAWTLTISDDTATNTGALNGWRLTLDRCAP